MMSNINSVRLIDRGELQKLIRKDRFPQLEDFALKCARYLETHTCVSTFYAMKQVKSKTQIKWQTKHRTTLSDLLPTTYSIVKVVVPKLMRTVTQIKAVFLSYHPQKFFRISGRKFLIAVITRNTDQHCDFGSTLPTEESHVTPCLGTTVFKERLSQRSSTPRITLTGIFNKWFIAIL